MTSLRPSTSDALQIAQSRLEAFDGVAADLGADGGLAVAGDWVVPLADRRRAAQADLERIASSSSTDKSATKRSPASNGKVDLPVLDIAPATSLHRRSFDDVWTSEGERDTATLYLLSTSPLTEAVLVPESTIAASAAMRLAVPSLCFLLALVGYYCGRNDGMLRWSPFICAMLGIAWLAFLQPPLVGWALLTTAVLCRLHSSLRTARNRRMVTPAPLRLAR